MTKLSSEWQFFVPKWLVDAWGQRRMATGLQWRKDWKNGLLRWMKWWVKQKICIMDVQQLHWYFLHGEVLLLRNLWELYPTNMYFYVRFLFMSGNILQSKLCKLYCTHPFILFFLFIIHSWGMLTHLFHYISIHDFGRLWCLTTLHAFNMHKLILVQFKRRSKNIFFLK